MSANVSACVRGGSREIRGEKSTPSPGKNEAKSESNETVKSY